ncbi:MAG: hypothetical protein QNK04_32330 [Myxococcota bacterium]|nr:hypothetical protein [Myxococcota bacterium]
MQRTGLLLQLVERIYEAVADPMAWHDFVSELSEAIGGAAVQMSLRLPDTEPTPDAYFRHGLDPAYHAAFVKHALLGLPWGSLDDEQFRVRFAFGSETRPDLPVEEAPFYLDFMKPQDLAAESPLCHVIASHEKRPIAGIVIYRRCGSRAFEPEDFELLDSLVPHLARAYAIHVQHATTRHERSALTEVIDRLPVGVILLDAEGRVVLKNRSVDQILDLRDGFFLDQGRPRVADSRENRSLQKLISEVSRSAPDIAHAGGSGVLCVTRASGRRAFPIWVGKLLAPAPDNRTDEAQSILFIADPDRGQISTTLVLESLYALTPAEAELVRLLAEGCSLDQVAEERGVTMNTVRSQLKQVFCKTDTSRQGELVHLVLTGVAAIRTDH